MEWMFGKPVDPVEMTRKWKREIQREMRKLEREIKGIERAEAKVKMSIKQMSKKGDMASAKTLVRELVMSRKAKTRLYTARAHLNSVSMALTTQLATIRVTKCIQSSAEVTAAMNKLVTAPQVMATARQMSMEMDKAGILQEMLEDTLEMDEDDMEEEVEEEVEKVFLEITAGLMAPAASVPSADLPQAQQEQQTKKDEDLLARVTALNS
eukprot:TRINITY_DN597_c0_g1_i1.p1 TRINITY_DN597_c0_g1~~TRINITY_DN597_c0_g1_i1.p1  ORF type:complete len:210 (-),score=71.15 TRINITY_DN597_c0_g1_i1:1394-2023(-)